MQSMVHCVGATPATCSRGEGPPPSCEAYADRCPCEFDMQKFPAMDFEYSYISQSILDEHEKKLERAAKDTSLRGAGISSWLGAEAKQTVVDEGSDDWRVALVGLGGGMLAQFLIEHSSGLSVDAIEVNSNVIDVARSFFWRGTDGEIWPVARCPGRWPRQTAAVATRCI